MYKTKSKKSQRNFYFYFIKISNEYLHQKLNNTKNVDNKIKNNKKIVGKNKINKLKLSCEWQDIH